MKKKQFLALFVLWLILASCCCTPARNENSGKKELPPVRALIFPEPKSLIPHEGNSYVDGQFTDMIFNNLIQANHQGNLSPELAESWDISNDQREYTFYLRRNVRFHDGRPFTAADAAFTLENLIAKLADHYAEIRYIEGNEDFLNKRTTHVSGIRVLDDHTLAIRLKEKFKFFLPFLAAEFTAIIPRDYAGRNEADPELRSKIRMLPGMDIINEAKALTEIGADFEADSFYIPLYYSANFVAIRDRIKTITFKYGEITDFARLEVAQ